MIKISFLLVAMLGGLIAFGAFHLVRGSEADLVEIAEPTVENPTPELSPTPIVEKLFFLRGIDLEQGEIALVLFNVGDDTLIVRDQAALKAAQNTAYVNTTTTNGAAAGSLLLAIMGVPPEETVAQVYRDDKVIATVSCPTTACGSFADSPDIDYAGLLDAAQPIIRVSDHFDSYATYTSTIAAIETDPNFMLLHARPSERFPTPRAIASMEINFPTVIAPASSVFDKTAHEILISTALSSALPTGASITSINITDLGTGVVADNDSMTPILAGGAPIPYPDMRYFAVSAKVTGASILSSDALDSLSNQTRSQYDDTADFAQFIRDRLQNDCDDCFSVSVDGGLRDMARMASSNPESYYLDYFDLRDTP
ncbi:MAG: hypothetical protein ACSHWY_03800 [Octadecabacter sp.]